METKVKLNMEKTKEIDPGSIIYLFTYPGYKDIKFIRLHGRFRKVDNFDSSEWIDIAIDEKTAKEIANAILNMMDIS